MKKFLTVLLVIAVMFTFSFGTAMAATDADAFSAAVAAYKSAKTYDGNGYLAADVETTPGWNGAISKTVFEAAIDAWADNVDLASVDYVNAGALKIEAITAMLNAIKTDVEAAQYDIELAKLNDLIASIDLAAYNKTGKTNLQTAIEAAETGVVLHGGTKDVTNSKNIKDTLIVNLKSAVDTNKTNLLSEAADTLAKDVAELEKELSDKSSDYYIDAKDWFATNPVTDADKVAAKASFDTDFNALVAYYEACIDKYEEQMKKDGASTPDKATIKTEIGKTFAAVSGNNPVNAAHAFQVDKQALAQNDVWTAYYDKAAADAKAELKADGTKKYYDADVDNLLAATKDALEADLWTAVSTGTFGTTHTSVWLLNTIENKDYDLQTYRAGAIDKITTDIATEKYAKTNWVGDRQDKVVDIQDDYSEKILLAKTTDDIDALVKEAKAAMDAIMTKDDVDNVATKVASRIKAAGYLTTCTTTTDGKGKIATADGPGFSSYFDVVVGSATTYKADIKTDALKAAAQVFVDAVLAEENDSITYKQIDEIIAANKDAAYAALKNVKTTEELKAEAAAVAELIKALPTTITIADKEQVLAAQAAMDAYMENAGAKQSDVTKNATLKSALSTIINAEDREVAKLIRALPTTPTVEDADKIAAARGAYDALEAAYGDYVGTAFTTVAALTAPTRLETAESALENAKLQNAAKLIGALTSASDKAEIEAAKAAYDALDTEHKLALNDQLYAKLMSAVESIEANADENAKAYVQDLSIKARSTKTSKGVKVTIKADVQELLDNGYTVEYKFYRSTKSNKNFGKAMITKTTGTYTNTKGVKGTKYYYKAKLVVKNAAGEVVATTPLTQCSYATRTF